VLPVQVALLNSMYGEDNGGFGTRRIRAGTGRKKAMLEGGGPLLFAGAKARKGGTRKSTIQCKACGQVGRYSPFITLHLKPYPLGFTCQANAWVRLDNPHVHGCACAPADGIRHRFMKLCSAGSLSLPPLNHQWACSYIRFWNSQSAKCIS
jgi:hypothetical protein